MADILLGSLLAKLTLDTTEFATGSTKAQRDLKSLRDRFTEFGNAWNRAGRRLSLGVTAPLAAFGVVAAKTASDAEELQSAFNETFDDLADSMNEWARVTGDAMGRSTQSIQEMANTFGIFFNQAAPTRKEAAEMSKAFTVLAQDLSSFFNVSGDVALQKLRSGLSGEAEPLRDFGVFLSAATVNAKALELGLAATSKEITEQDKIMARYAIILEETTDAQGDVARTSEGTANQARAFTEALEELRVVIGQKLLPVLTPLIKGATNLVNAFNGLPSGVQTAIVAFGALAASIGPLMLVMSTLAVTILPLFAAKFGVVGLAISAFINPLGTAIGLLINFVAQLGALTILKTIGALLLRFAGPLGLIVTAGILISQHWDKIAPIFREFWETAKATLGPPLQELIETLRMAFEELWTGPLGDGIRAAGEVIMEFARIVGSAFGSAMLQAIRLVLEAFIQFFEVVADGIRAVNAILNGDFRSAAELMITVADRLSFGVISSISRLVKGVTTWIRDRLNAVWQGVIDKIETVKRAFFNLYDAVVGNSYVPDMVDGIAREMARLDEVMVKTAMDATTKTKREFQALASDVQSILERVFPEQAAFNRLQNDRRTLERGVAQGLISQETADEARFRLRPGAGEAAQVSAFLTQNTPLNSGVDVQGAAEAAAAAIAGLGETARRTFTDLERFGNAAFSELGFQLSGLITGAQSAGEALRNLVARLADLAFNALFDSLGGSLGIPGFAKGTNFAPGGLAWVGEEGPELVNLPRGSQVIPNHQLGRMGQVNVTQHIHAPDMRTGRDSASMAAMRLRHTLNAR